MVQLGGGRRHAGHPVDHAVGLTEVRGVGDPVGPDLPLALIHARDEDDHGGSGKTAARCLYHRVGATGSPPPAVHERIV